MVKSYYLEQLKKQTPLYPLGMNDPKKKLGVMERIARQAQNRNKPDKTAELKEVAAEEKWNLK